MTVRHPGDARALVILSSLSREGVKLCNVFHHVADVRALDMARARCRRDASVGPDGEAIDDVDLERLAEELGSGTYRPRPCGELLIPKTSGGHRRIVVPCSRDKIVQASVARVLRAVWRPIMAQDVALSWRRSAARSAARWYTSERCRWVLETDLADCFDTIRRDRLLGAIRERITDRRLIRLVSVVMGRDVGVPQGLACAPALCEVYLSSALDGWWKHWRRETMHGQVWASRYVDDAVFGFERSGEARRFAVALRERLATWGLSAREEKTILRPTVGSLRFLGLDRTREDGKAIVVRLSRRLKACEGSPEAVEGLWRYYRRLCSRRALASIQRARKAA